MATLLELRQLYTNTDMTNKISAAVAITMNKVMTGVDNVAPFSQAAGAHDLRVIYAKERFGQTAGESQKYWEAVLSKNNTATVGQITSASDVSIQSNVDESVDLFAGVQV